ncbi:hypothetical protein [Arthrobacter sp. zg-Y238]|uniref:hypothetical protein n=1 Tax=Arthrobacter sp. zg-Y238 TaxID=2964614 RepID=UPI0021046464|nr:hypothetical protein [Arthrobacter sp. zg-Y238]MCQ1951708.1 hypothetical protein [Arthrobacter sp. zg-Y238]
MEKPLRVLVRIDTRNAAASIEVRGALTGASCGTLLNILQHTATLGADICVNLTRTARIEAAALEVLAGVADDVERSAPAHLQLRVHIQLPPDALPGHPTAGSLPPGSQEALDNETALEMILRRDTRVLAGLRETAPRDTAVPAGTAPRWRSLPARPS